LKTRKKDTAITSGVGPIFK